MPRGRAWSVLESWGELLQQRIWAHDGWQGPGEQLQAGSQGYWQHLAMERQVEKGRWAQVRTGGLGGSQTGQQ